MVSGVLLAPTHCHTGPRHAAVLIGEAALLIATASIEHPLIRAPLAAAACGLQNGMISGLPEMPIRTTHFTGTTTDLGLLVALSRRHGLDYWKAAILNTTVLLFVGGAVAGVVVGGRIGDRALTPAAVACLAFAAANALHHCRCRERLTTAHQPPPPLPGHARSAAEPKNTISR
ncbi:hypothetical protein BHQ23_06395 [Mycobacterium gordonae]|jgi:uncharacterized membrane protein YoaK (UPF0700 family)|uniref:DUF1275 domain-containing protein n=1 Tax=Mycobacterium gordonae TaxID=1778 RepID=A0A1A6BCK8_MYCGO|nr:hypothetical protein A9W98_26960 [Mycobacterium gordonae]ODR23016.1 hypothetical protein BHQ23_06395 [Mycobacterium gordonae]ORV92234.1 hypothetical protein AWC08_19655 [Mycobacterium gordonae]